MAEMSVQIENNWETNIIGLPGFNVDNSGAYRSLGFVTFQKFKYGIVRADGWDKSVIDRR